MLLNRREFLQVGAVGGAAWAAGCGSSEDASRLAGTTGSIRFEMTITDGYAYVFSEQRKRLLIGAIDAVHAGETVRHPILLEVKQGTVTDGLAPAGGDWDLTGYHVELDLGQRSTPLHVPDETWPEVIICPAGSDWNNLAWLPNASKVYQGKKMKARWAAELTSRLVITQGELTVQEPPIKGHWRFIDKGKEVWKQPMSDRTMIAETLPADGKVTFRLYERTPDLPTSEKPVRTLTVASNGGKIELEIRTGVTSPIEEAGQMHPHFSRFAALMDDSSATGVIAQYFPCEGDPQPSRQDDPGGQRFTPGIFCPYVTYDA